jgi:hypothetical protein
MATKPFNPSSTAISKATKIEHQLDALSEKRIAWEAGSYAKSNNELYSLLGEIKSVYDNRFVNADDDTRRVLRSSLVAKLAAMNPPIKATKTSTTLTLLVRYVFKSDRKRAHGYVTVLRAAHQEGVAAEGLPAFIEREGGVEQIKLKAVKTEEAKQRQAELEAAKVTVKADIETATTTPFTYVEISGLTGDFAVALLKPMPEGNAAVIGFVSDADASLVQAVEKRMAKALVDKKGEANSLNNEVDSYSGVNSANDSQHKQAA